MLVEKNDEEELNLNALCVVGAGEGGLIALNWSVFDWNFASTATLKQGQDVKAIGLLSPAYSFKGITVKDALIHPVVGKQLSIFLAVGKKDAKSITDAKRIHQTLAGFHPKPGPASEERRAEEDFYYFEKDTNLAGTDLLEKTLKTPRDFADFLTRRIAAHLDDDNFEWVDRHTKSVDGN